MILHSKLSVPVTSNTKISTFLHDKTAINKRNLDLGHFRVSNLMQGFLLFQINLDVIL